METTTFNRTPGPCRLEGAAIVSEQGETIALGSSTEADAHFLVRAWNAHDDLLAACEAVVKVREALDIDQTWLKLDDAAQKARAAIKKAKA